MSSSQWQEAPHSQLHCLQIEINNELGSTHRTNNECTSDLDAVNSPLPSSSNNIYNCCSSTHESLSTWLEESAWPGLGLFGESYMLFSLGTLQPLWKVLFPDCLSGVTCSARLLHAPATSVVMGVITGMLVFGYLANRIGRRIGSIATASIMASGAVGLTIVSMTLCDQPARLFQWLSVLLFVFGLGVGGEYPLSASLASEKSMVNLRKRQLEEQQRRQKGWSDFVKTNSASNSTMGTSEKRGRAVQLVFTMQGMGIFFNSFFMMALFVITGQTGQQDANGDAVYNQRALIGIWNTTYAVGAVVLLYVLVSRYRHLQESAIWQEDKQQRDQLARNSCNASVSTDKSRQANGDYHQVTDASVIEQQSQRSQSALPSQQSPAAHFITSPSSTISSLSVPSVVVHLQDDNPFMVLKEVPSEDARGVDAQTSPTVLLMKNFGVRLVGVSLCWLLWDVAFYGNKLFQSTFLLALTGDETTLFQFALAATLNSSVALLGYFGAALLVDHPMVGRSRLQIVGFLLTGTLFISVGFLYNSLSPTILVLLYLGSSFFGQLGPNATTFLIPAEIFPTEMRTFCHGIAAASGKVGALLASIVFNRAEVLDMFLFSGYAAFAACIVSYWTIPESNGLDLYELDCKWRMTLDGRKAEYDGQANQPYFLSTYERHRLTMAHRRRQFSGHVDQSHLEGIYDF